MVVGKQARGHEMCIPTHYPPRLSAPMRRGGGERLRHGGRSRGHENRGGRRTTTTTTTTTTAWDGSCEAVRREPGQGRGWSREGRCGGGADNSGRLGGCVYNPEGGRERLDGRLASVAVVADSLPLWLSSKGPGPGSGTRGMFEHAIKPDTAEPDSRHRDNNRRKGTHYVHTYNRGMGRGGVCVLTDR